MKKVTQEQILKIVCNYYDIEPELLLKKTRKRNIVQKRQLFFYLCCKWTEMSLDDIGCIALKYGRKLPFDHATVIHSRNTITNLMFSDKELNQQFNELDYQVNQITKIKQNKNKNLGLDEVMYNLHFKIDELEETLQDKEIEIDGLLTRVGSILATGLSTEEKTLLEMFRGVDGLTQKDIMFKVRVGSKIYKQRIENQVES